MKAVILAGGLGTRLHPFTQIIPKPMLPVGDRSILEIQIEHLKKFGVDEIFFAANYKSDLLETYFGDGSKYGVKIEYSIEDKRLGTCGPLSLLKDKLDEPFIVVNGDVLTNIDYKKSMDFHNERDGTLTVVSKEVIYPLSYGNLVTEKDQVVGLVEKPDIKVMIVAGIYMMSPSVFKYIPDDEYFGMDQLINGMLEVKDPVYRYVMEEYWLDIGRMEDYEKAQKDVKIHFSNEDTKVDG